MAKVNTDDVPAPKQRKSRKAKEFSTSPEKQAAVNPEQITKPFDTSEMASLPMEYSAKRVWHFISTNSAVLDLFVNTLTFLIVSCFGTWLILKQNDLVENQNSLMENQNALIKQQMSLDEASRRGALITLMSNIMDKVDDEIKDTKDDLIKIGLSRTVVDTVKYSLSQSLIGQIAALSHSFKPYRYLEGDSLVDRPLSPERGQLLITLTRLPLDGSTLNEIYKVSNFTNAGLEGSNLKKANLNGARLNRADLRNGYLLNVDLGGADLRGADLRNVFLLNSDLKYALLFGADLSNGELTGADLTGAHLVGVNLRGAKLRGAKLKSVDLREVDLAGADLTGADLSEARLNLAQATSLKSVKNCLGLADSIAIPLRKSHPQLFEEPRN